MNDLDFESTIEGISSHKIEELVFSYPGVGKYRRCRIYWAYDVFPDLGKKAPRAIVASIGKQEYRFHGPLKPAMVTFKPDSSGPKSLKDVWKKLEIIEVVYNPEVPQ